MAFEEILTNSAEETTQFGRAIAARLATPALVLLKGDLGSGKTTLSKGIVSGLGVAREEDVTSPTFTLVHSYKKQGPQALKVFHVDLYRLEGTHDLESIALEDLLAEPAVVIIEWSERLTLRSDWPIVRIELEHQGGDCRRLRVTGLNELIAPANASGFPIPSKKAT
ncbi:MAG TPA: tRNA (adenosine(37)-N6)-threonylcarbamoyltransferase complex ATPase subunit type 1 TsaE [Candidatus Acidoferrales bacterium]|nr:tRNA (adenosine(37)-N6)-threonylcarbamoyltransferase complex ATPase subunit type 1 TsaE [Candidatus Acidoferrales bacterium]